MSMPLSRVCLPALVSTLTTMRSWLDKPDARASEAVLLEARLAPDMFAFPRQYQIASDTAKSAVARLTGGEAPAMPDTEATFDQLQARLDKTLDYVGSIDPAAIDAAGARAIELNFPNGGGLRFDGETYVTGFVLPNLYFHAATAYGLLRSHGVAIGKFDFLGHLAPYAFAAPETAGA